MFNKNKFYNMKNLENYDVQELDAREIQETDGGWWQYVVLWLAWEMATNPQHTLETLQAGFDSYER